MEEVKKRDCMEKARPFISMVVLQVGLAGMDILSKAVLNKGMSNYVLVVYRHAVATIVMAPFAFYFDKKVRPKMTLMIFFKISLLGLLEPVIDQNLYYLGMKYTTATFATAMYNVLPAITFVLAYIFGLERVKLRCIRSTGKVVGTLATVGGAMIMTLVKGPVLDLFWTKGVSAHNTAGTDIHSAIKGAVLVTIGCFSYACFMILQAITLRTYPAELSLTAWICLMGTIEGTAVALVMEKGNPSAWAIGWDTKLLTATYSGIVCSALAYYVGGVVMKTRGPVFVTAFSPLCMIIVAIMSTIIFAEQMYLGRVLGAVVICAGLYLVIWGKGKDYKYNSTLQLDDESAQPKLELSGNGKDNVDHEVITISKQGEQRRTAVETV
ncbi:WAT1-related protein [Arabidopsis thaliana]|jgi:drug/metabolite transporter (DMT)-like permease|uniref:WAT1-related protein At2g37460 n=4 Tax=Arabidopsis TaxID=3701 RepID=WTR13_ARATH|nr:nodulin MtN21 /EamA-like transporter family protein [Arabidopsis thaliana]Q9ZUS1.1 RecName: Full=WAT1-related protein At2g37460 [Arabidopsis thaliana]KAG7638839.1 EamA domain [Arabidopsis thaliana x Arabidopsis arenosa]KAG7643437.1 EamA domain [Arabidopsis suecica]AAC98072.1 nodulin-like protein [Arabidopsis thaliana]AAK59607.1 putative nodulin protein [Arabidopsis thaliana]AAK73261.1 nodulin-like protein [Arabidopsis thaliana]|eukprot:NP_181282.1 nodulin MtN21 /EamA-like transporter family protein [Arabidopsis thaliana]